MSATMHLYEIAKNVKWVSGPYYSLKPSELTNEIQMASQDVFEQVCKAADEKFGKDDYSDEKDAWIKQENDKKDPLYVGRWDDDKEHDTFVFYKCNKKTLKTRNRRMGKYKRLARQYFGEYIQNGWGKYNQQKFLVLNEVLYRQGWFFADDLFKHTESIYFAFDKISAKRLLDRLVNTSDHRGKEAYEAFVAKLNEYGDDDHFIMEIAW